LRGGGAGSLLPSPATSWNPEGDGHAWVGKTAMAMAIDSAVGLGLNRGMPTAVASMTRLSRWLKPQRAAVQIYRSTRWQPRRGRGFSA
jgi:hypothetical protein